MDIDIDPLSAVPIYQQLRDRVVEAIADGRLARGTALSPIRTLAAAFGINPATVAKGYDLLRAEGFVAANAKSGTFVARDPSTGPPPPDFLAEWDERTFTLLAEARAHGATPEELAERFQRLLTRLSPLEGPRP